jgi:hypothetical protein
MVWEYKERNKQGVKTGLEDKIHEVKYLAQFLTLPLESSHFHSQGVGFLHPKAHFFFFKTKSILLRIGQLFLP